MTPVGRHLQFWTEWRWYGYAEPYYGYEGFRSHLFLIGFKITR